MNTFAVFCNVLKGPIFFSWVWIVKVSVIQSSSVSNLELKRGIIFFTRIQNFSSSNWHCFNLSSKLIFQDHCKQGPNKHTIKNNESVQKSHFVIFVEHTFQTEATTNDENIPTIVENSSPNDENSAQNVENDENSSQNVENDDADFVDVDEVEESIEKKVEMNPDEVEESDNVRHLREVNKKIEL